MTPAQTDVERVAKAIFREDFPTGHKRGEWRKVSDAMRENYRAAARAAIAAMQPSLSDAAKVLCATELPYYVVEMPLTESGNGPATIGFDAAKMTYVVWDAYTLEIVGPPYELLSDANRAWLRALSKEPNDP